jgi:hexosaminidase
MRTKLLFLVAALTSLHLFAQESDPSGVPALIPAPVSQTVNAGHFELPGSIVIEALDQRDLGQALQDLKTHLTVPTGFNVTVTQQPSSNATIRLVLNKSAEATLGNEGYFLSVTPQAVVIRANQPAGIFYGVQTLLQLLPKEIESRQPVTRHSWQTPCVTITDYPRFGWRGLMFDVSRHFFTKQEVKDFIDQMVKYKFNLLHMHLTDDEGWRVEIKTLPRLTSFGAWNAKREGTFGTFANPAPDEKRDFGGFYTQDDIRELVAYAKARFVNILPEIDMPGHSLAAVVSYPELSLTDGADKYHVRSGEKTMNW